MITLVSRFIKDLVQFPMTKGKEKVGCNLSGAFLVVYVPNLVFHPYSLKLIT